MRNVFAGHFPSIEHRENLLQKYDNKTKSTSAPAKCHLQQFLTQNRTRNLPFHCASSAPGLYNCYVLVFPQNICRLNVGRGHVTSSDKVHMVTWKYS